MTTLTTTDGRRLHYVEAGEGEPAVVFEAGMGASGTCWAAVQQQVATHTRTVSYDRAALGRSDPTTGNRTLGRIVEDLDALLDHLGAARYVLVGHSWGGPIVRLAAGARRHRVAGVVLVDPTDETCPLYTNPRMMWIQRAVMRLQPLLARTGLLRRGMRRAARRLPEPARSDLPRLDASLATAQASRAEFACIDAGLAELRAAPPDLGDLPVTTISGTRPTGMGKRNRAALTASHRASAARLANGRLVLAERSGHLVPLSEPALVAEEVLRLVDQVSASSV